MLAVRLEIEQLLDLLLDLLLALLRDELVLWGHGHGLLIGGIGESHIVAHLLLMMLCLPMCLAVHLGHLLVELLLLLLHYWHGLSGLLELLRVVWHAVGIAVVECSTGGLGEATIGKVIPSMILLAANSCHLLLLLHPTHPIHLPMTLTVLALIRCLLVVAHAASVIAAHVRLLLVLLACRRGNAVHVYRHQVRSVRCVLDKLCVYGH